MVAEHETTTTWPLPFGEQAELELKCDFGSVRIEPVGDSQQARIEASGRDADRVEVRVTTEGNLVKAKISQEQAHRWGRWDVQFTVYVPRDLRARVRTEAGRLMARDLGPCTLEVSAGAGSVDLRDLNPCELQVKSDAGRVRLRDIRGRLRVKSDAGQVQGQGLAGSFDVESDAGQVDLQIDALDPGEHRVRTDVGAVKVELAPGIDVRIETRASLGSARSEYPSRPNAAAVLRVTTDVGSVRVRSRTGEGGWFEHDEDRTWWGRVPIPPIPPIPPFPGMPRVWPFVRADDDDEEDVRDREPSPPPAGSPRRTPDPDVERILKMVESGQLSAKDAAELLRAMAQE